MRFGSAWSQANIMLIDKPTVIAPGIHLISLVADKPGTLELRELSLAMETPEGLTHCCNAVERSRKAAAFARSLAERH
jgi:7,8-dihydropterin-6-yl-methyl-4-(beta-D-ribofuranosyl)aminobenzene 5'-phosphate synthase